MKGVCLTFVTLSGEAQMAGTPMSKFCRFTHFPILVLVMYVIAALPGCATYEAQNTENLLSAAGFRTRTPSTASQQAMFNRMTPYKIERRIRNGKVLYAYADKAKNVVYIGGETEFQRYKQLGLQQSIAQQNLQAAEINEEASLYDFGPYWGPWNPWW